MLAPWESDSQKEQWPLSALLSGRKLLLQFSSWCQVHLDSSPIVPILFELLPKHWSSEKWVQVSPYMGSFRGNAWILKVFISLSQNPRWVLHPEIVGTSLSGTGTLGWGLGVVLGHSGSSRGSSAAKISLLILTAICAGGTSSFLVSTPPTSLQVAASLYA